MISHTLRCIFIHIPKTGGTSVENIVWPPAQKQRSAQDLWMGFVDRYHNKYQTGGLQHLLARHILQETGSEIFNSYFKFTIVRNPWDRTISQYLYMKGRDDLRDFIGMRVDDPLGRYLELIQDKAHVQWLPQVAFIRDQDGRNLVDFIGRFEAFDQSVVRIMDRLGMRVASIPHENRTRRDPYRHYYDPETSEMVASMYAEDIKLFGYTFEGA